MKEQKMKAFSRIVPEEMYNRFQKEADDWHELNELKKKWICDICGESTFEVDFDYLLDFNTHLQCGLRRHGS